MEVPDYYEEVSIRLTRVLDTTGLGEKDRWKIIETWLQNEELLSVGLANFKNRVHIFGSRAEATTTNDLHSDIDVVDCCNGIIVLQDLHSWEPVFQTLLVITDDTTPPGYVELQGVYNDAPVPICNLQKDALTLDRYGRSVLYNTHTVFKKRNGCENHGPANTHTGPHSLSLDHVIALRAVSWPFTALEWIIRHREYNWPSQEILSNIQQSGTLFVPVGHKLSPDKHIEWRISLSYGEKILLLHFNSTQYKCYVLLKMINKYFIKSKFGENVLTSYHCKTCMFYMIETTPAALWQPQHLLLCIDLCLRKLCTWVEEGNCPNYFIPSENMFLGKVYGPIQSSLAVSLRDLFGQKGRYLTRIPYDEVGQKLIRVCQSHITHMDDTNKRIGFCMGFAVGTTWLSLRSSWFNLLHNGVQINPCILSSSSGVRQEINTILMTFCCSSIGSHLASKCLELEVIDNERLDLAHEFLLLGASSDVASGRLKLAACYLIQNNVILAEAILQSIAENYTFLVANITREYLKDLMELRIVNENLSTTEVVRYYCAYPVPYLPSEIHCTPRALIPEMFRSTESYQGSLNPDKDYWQSWAVVDPNFYLHFLEHQCYHRLNKILHKTVALDNMFWVIGHEKLEYKDTALNLLAYCLKKEGLLVQAYTVLSKSMKLKNHHNAAKWQIACLISAAFRWTGDSRLFYSQLVAVHSTQINNRETKYKTVPDHCLL